MELAQIMNAQKAEEMRGYTPYGGGGGGGAPSYGGGGDGPSYGGGGGGGGGGYGGPQAPAEPQGPPDEPPSGYGEQDQSEGPSGGPNEGSNYHGPQEQEDYSGPPPQQQQYGPPDDGPPQGGHGPGDNDGGYSNEGDAYRQEGHPGEGDGYRQEGPAPQSNYDQGEEERQPSGRGYGGPPQHVGQDGYGQDTPPENYNGKYRQLIVDRPHQQQGGPQDYQQENNYEPPKYQSVHRHPSYESSGYENEKALKPHALPQAQYVQQSGGYSQPDANENYASQPANEQSLNGGFRPMNGQPVSNGYNVGSTREYYQNDPV